MSETFRRSYCTAHLASDSRRRQSPASLKASRRQDTEQVGSPGFGLHDLLVPDQSPNHRPCVCHLARHSRYLGTQPSSPIISGQPSYLLVAESLFMCWKRESEEVKRAVSDMLSKVRGGTALSSASTEPFTSDTCAQAEPGLSRCCCYRAHLLLKAG